jgi:CSLREA domain-containing protein
VYGARAYSFKIIAVSLLFFITLIGRPVHANDIYVTTNLDGVIDNGLCSLREAIIAANIDQSTGGCSAGSGTDTIYLENSTTYTLSESGTNEDESMTGDLDIIEDLTIIGGSSATQKSTIRGGDMDRVIHIIGSINVNIQYLNMEDGYATSSDGGCLYNKGGTLTLTAVSISECTADNNGGGLFNTNNGTVTLNNGTIHQNIASADGGGIYNESGSITLTDSHAFENQSSQNGGGVFNEQNGIFNLVGTIGKAHMSSTVRNNSAEKGGGIYNNGTLWLKEGEVRCNTISNDGAGIYNTGIMTIMNSSIRSNTASGASANGGGIFNTHQGGAYDVWIQYSAISQNTVSEANSLNGDGGGIYNGQDSTIGFINSTISTNASSDTGGGIYNNGEVSFQYCTVKDNLAGDNDNDGGGLFNAVRSSVKATFTAAIMDNEDNCQVSGNSAIVSNGYNIDSGDSCNFDTGLNDQLNTPPMLGTFQDNGGPTNTHALQEGSPAIDPSGNNTCPQSDQRGAWRPTHPFAPTSLGTCDIGAYEYKGIILTAIPGSSVNGVHFSGSARDRNEQSDKTDFSTDDYIDVDATITVSPDDVGKNGHIAILVVYNNNFYMKNRSGIWQSWDGDINTLEPNYTKILDGDEALNIVSGLTGLPGKFYVYVAYVNESGQIIYGDNPITFTVSE